MSDQHLWIEELPAAVTVTDDGGTIVAMNRRAVAALADDGGEALLGSDVLACHPEPSRSLLRELFAERRAHHYTITKGGRRTIVHQLPWFAAGEFAGFVEIAIPIPDRLPHHQRGEANEG